MPRKQRRLIVEGDVSSVFSDEQIAELCKIAKLKCGADASQRFAESVRTSVRTFIREIANRPTLSLTKELQRLERAASSKKYKKVLHHLTNLSPVARGHFQRRLQTPGWSRVTQRMPEPDDLLDTKRQDRTCDIIARLCRSGVSIVKQKRMVLLYAKSRQHPLKREPESKLYRNLRLAYLEAIEKAAAKTAHAEKPGPFARFVRKVFKLVGASDVDAINLINAQNERSKEVAARQTVIDALWDRMGEKRWCVADVIRETERRTGIPLKRSLVAVMRFSRRQHSQVTRKQRAARAGTIGRSMRNAARTKTLQRFDPARLGRWLAAQEGLQHKGRTLTQSKSRAGVRYWYLTACQPADGGGDKT